MRRAAKKDANHEAIAARLVELGWSVCDLSAHGRGVPDLAVGRPGWACLVEVKNPDGKGTKLTKDEQRVRNLWTGPYLIVTSPDDAAAQLLAEWRGWRELAKD